MVPLIHKQVVVTLAYVAHFKFPLTAQEVWERLIVVGGDHGYSAAQVKRALVELEEKGVVTQTQSYYRVANQASTFLSPQHRQHRAGWAIEKVQEAAPFISFCKLFPWVKAVAVTGSVAVANAVQDDDVDFLIICQRDRLWLMRPLLVGVASWYGKRRTWVGEEKNSWCLNFWLDEAAIELKNDRHSLYTAYELCQAQWVVNKHQQAERFLLANLWAGRIVPNLFIRSYSQLAQTSSQSSSLQRGRQWWQGIAAGVWKSIDRMGNGFWVLLNQGAYAVQRRYMKAHQTREEVTAHAAFFHPRDTKGQIMKTLTTTLSADHSAQAQVGLSQAVHVAQQAREHGKKVVLVTGVFDLLHAAHQEFLQKAKQVGDVLIVGIESDVRVRQLKGEGRPVQTQNQRVEAIERLRVAQAVFVLPEQFADKQDHLQLMQALKPNILAVSEHTPHLEGKRKILAEMGGEVVVVMEQDPTLSTTQLLQSKQY